MKYRSVRDKTILSYEKHAGIFESRKSCASVKAIPPFMRAVIRRLPARSHILDFGCGAGHDAAAFFALGFRVTGIDATPQFIASAKKRCKSGRFIVADMVSSRLPPGPCDAVWANASLIHIPKSHLPGVLRKINRRLPPGGILAATLHNGQGEGIRERTWIPGRFFASYLKDELRELVEDAGFEILYLKGVVNQERKGRWLNLIARPSQKSRARKKAGAIPRA